MAKRKSEKKIKKIFKKRKLTRKKSKRLWLFTVWIVVIFFFTFMLLNIYGPRISRESLLRVPVIKSALDENPDAQINETLISRDDSQQAVLDILEKCGKDVELKDYVLVEVEAEGSIIMAYFDLETQEAVCVFTESVGDGNGGGGGGSGGGGGGGSGGGGSVTPCSVSAECDDSNPFTSDACVEGFCQNALMSCAAIGGILCGDGFVCSGYSAPASDGSCCLAICNPIEEDECQTNIECDDSYEPTLDTCEGTPKKCVHTLMACYEMGYYICLPTQECSTSFIVASNTNECCPGECLVSQGTRCTLDSDCPSTNPNVAGSCGVSGYCEWTHLQICAGGDDTCPKWCGVENDTDCI
jgi:hypothetical protein